MNEQDAMQSELVVAGFGSPHGDDQAGWKLIARLSRRSELPVRLVCVREGTQLIPELTDCNKLIVVDACRGQELVGTISRFCWPDPQIRQHHDRSTHEIGLSSALELATQLGKLPAEVVVFGIEIANEEAVGGISGEVLKAVEELEEVIVGEIRESCAWNDQWGTSPPQMEPQELRYAIGSGKAAHSPIGAPPSIAKE